MHVTSVSEVAASADGQRLFAGVSFGVTTTDRIGVLGPNGSGKTTLLRIVAALDAPEAGEVIPRRDARVVYLPQRSRLDGHETALGTVLGSDDQGVRRHEAEALLDRLGIAPDARHLSTGQRRRVDLARTLVGTADLLVLDEPTNHLDVDSVDWLERELAGRDVGLMLVTHDRYLLERLTTRMLEVDPVARVVHWHAGAYSDVLAAQAERRSQRVEADQRRQNLLRKEIAWLRRDPKARTSRPKFRAEQAQALMAAPLEVEPDQLQLGTGRRRLGTQVIDLTEVSVAFGDHQVLDRISFGLGPGDRVGIVGPNGAGKTTLLRVLAGELDPDSGDVRVGRTVEVGVYHQEASVPSTDTRVIDTITDVAEHVPLATGETLPAGRLAERFGFDDRLVNASVARLSGGERRRLALLHLLVAAPNVLILDEPTNDLDLETLRALEDHLDGFTGTLVVASHDRYLLDRLTDGLHAIEEGRLLPHLHWDAYRDEQLRAHEGSSPSAAPTASARDNRRRQEHRREVRALERRIERLERRRATLHADLAAVATDFEAVARLDRERLEVDDELSVLEERWLEITVD